MTRILRNRRPTESDDGCIDEIVVDNPSMVRIEQMDDDCWWIGIYLPGGARWSGHFISGPGGARFVEHDSEVIWDLDECHPTEPGRRLDLLDRNEEP
ncbi:MAG: hypothetical protein FWC87_16740 [Acidimicrobiaceae bacterium]|nr:hypothetical protein [Acidimicrobiaceae bacterium]